MKSKNHKEIYKQICDFMGEDLNASACKEVAKHLESCPRCKVYFDTVKKTVTLCKEIEKDIEVPDDVQKRLFRVLDIGNLSAR